MGSFVGVQKIAAKRIGMDYEDYLAHLASGLKWCTFGKHWENRSLFPPDSTRGSGKAQACKFHFVSLHKTRKRKQKRCDRPKIKDQAGHKVNRAIEKGLIPNPNTLPCLHCGHIGSDKRHEYHHHRGYEIEFHLDVIPLCSLCHRIEDRKLRGLETFIVKGELDAFS